MIFFFVWKVLYILFAMQFTLKLINVSCSFRITFYSGFWYFRIYWSTTHKNVSIILIRTINIFIINIFHSPLRQPNRDKFDFLFQVTTFWEPKTLFKLHYFRISLLVTVVWISVRTASSSPTEWALNSRPRFCRWWWMSTEQ